MAHFNIPCYDVKELMLGAEESEFYDDLVESVNIYSKNILIIY